MLTLTPPDAMPVETQTLIAGYIALRDKIEAIQNDYNNRLQAEIMPLQKHLETLENTITTELLRVSKDESKRSIKTSVGTAFRVRWDQFKVENREEWIGFVFNTQAESMVTNHLSKEAIKEHMEEHNGLLPPGLAHEH